jgi:hypothetical protein
LLPKGKKTMMMPAAVILIATSMMSGMEPQSGSVRESGFAHRDTATGRFGVPSGEVASEAEPWTRLETMGASEARLTEDRLTGRAGGVRVRLHGAFRSALVRDGHGDAECTTAEGTRDEAEVQP